MKMLQRFYTMINLNKKEAIIKNKGYRTKTVYYKNV